MTGKERGLTILQRVRIRMVFTMLGMSVEALVEKQRLTVVDKERGGNKRFLSMSVI